jgi:hypothetical protein
MRETNDDDHDNNEDDDDVKEKNIARTDGRTDGRMGLT